MTHSFEQSRPMLVELPLRVKTYDIDFAGHVSNIVYIRWLEDLWLKLLDEYFPLEPQLEQGFGPVLVKTEIEYKRALRLGDKPVGRMWMAEVTRARWTVQAEITVDGNAAARATQVGCFVNMSTGRPISLPEPLRTEWESAV